MTAQTSKTQSTAKTVHIFPFTNRTQSVVLETVMSAARQGYGDYTAGQMAYAVAYVLGTGRLWGEQDMKLRALSAYNTCKLIDAMVSAGCKTVDEGAKYLSANL